MGGNVGTGVGVRVGVSVGVGVGGGSVGVGHGVQVAVGVHVGGSGVRVGGIADGEGEGVVETYTTVSSVAGKAATVAGGGRWVAHAI
jgi:hypothetical protein